MAVACDHHHSQGSTCLSRRRPAEARRHVGVVSVDEPFAAECFQLADLASPEPTPEFAAQVAEQCEQLLAALDSNELREIAIKKMEGYTNEEIATPRGCACRTIERKLQIIRKIWEKHDELE